MRWFRQTTFRTVLTGMGAERGVATAASTPSVVASISSIYSAQV